jgi:hypothetical protein
MAEDKPSEIYPTKTVVSTPSQMPPLLPDPSIFGASYDQLLNHRGVRMMHAKAAPCPNIQTVDDNAHQPNCPFCDNNGFLHYDEKEIFATFGGNSIQKTFEAHGVWEIGMATITAPTEYPDGTEADFNTYDRIRIPDFTVRLWELKEYEPRPGFIQELRYPIEKVDYASAIVNNVQVFYKEGVDFNINADGQIVWVFGKTPAFDKETGHGQPITWVFYAEPVYYVVQTLRELRITQELSQAGQKVAKRLPQSILVKRDFLPNKAETIVNT